MPRHNTPKLALGYGWYLGEHPGTESLDELRLHFDAIVEENFAFHPLFSSGLYYYYRGANLVNRAGAVVRVPSGRVMLNANATNYVSRNGDGVVSVSTQPFTADQTPLGIATTSNNAIIEQVDMRPSNPPANTINYVGNPGDVIGGGTVQSVLAQIISYLQMTLGHVKRTYVYEQLVPSALWDIQHNLGHIPEVNLVDLNGNQFFAEVDYVDPNHITVTFSEPQTGRAFLTYTLGSNRPAYEQVNPSLQWFISHDLGITPNVLTVDFSGNEIQGEVDYPDTQTVIITFGIPQSGRAYLS